VCHYNGHHHWCEECEAEAAGCLMWIGVALVLVLTWGVGVIVGVW
jgi:hypothetical protein